MLSRENHSDKKLEYQNMVICCPGAISDSFHCDKLKGEQDISFSLFDDLFISTLKYQTKTGKIESSNPVWDKEIDSILNLNNEILKANRLATLNGVIEALSSRHWTSGEIRKKLVEWDNKNKEGKFKPYCGIIILNKKKSSLIK